MGEPDGNPATVRPLVVGIGHPLAGDDAAGRLAAGRLAQRSAGPGLRPFDIAEAAGDMGGLLPLLDGRDRVVLIDACRGGGPAGSLHRFDASAPLPASRFAVSSHGLGLPHAIELARALGRLPRRCVVLAIEGASFEPGAPLSAAVLAAFDELCARAEAEVAAMLAGR